MNKWRKKTDDVLLKMLRENTGRDMCDSGDFYGRNYDRNARRDLMAEPVTTVEIEVEPGRDHNVTVHASLFHWLRERVVYDSDLQRQFLAFCRRKANKESYDLENMEGFAAEKCKLISPNRWGEDPSYYTENSSNRDNILDQTIQWTAWPIEEPEYALLQVHGGCDIRGGYTDPKAFSLPEGDLNITDATISCSHCSARWQTDDSVHWYFDGVGEQEKYLQSSKIWRVVLPVVPPEGASPPAQQQRDYLAGMTETERRAWEIVVALSSKRDDIPKAKRLWPAMAWDRIAATGEEKLMQELLEIRKNLKNTLLELPGGRYTCPLCPTGVLQAWA